MAKQGTNKKTVISGEFRATAPAKPAPIGFKRSQEDEDASDQLSVITCSELAQHWGQRADVNNAILNVVLDYMNKRAKLCYTEGLDRDLMVMLDKIYTRHFDKSF